MSVAHVDHRSSTVAETVIQEVELSRLLGKSLPGPLTVLHWRCSVSVQCLHAGSERNVEVDEFHTRDSYQRSKYVTGNALMQVYNLF